MYVQMRSITENLHVSHKRLDGVYFLLDIYLLELSE